MSCFFIDFFKDLPYLDFSCVFYGSTFVILIRLISISDRSWAVQQTGWAVVWIRIEVWTQIFSRRQEKGGKRITKRC